MLADLGRSHNARGRAAAAVRREGARRTARNCEMLRSRARHPNAFPLVKRLPSDFADDPAAPAARAIGTAVSLGFATREGTPVDLRSHAISTDWVLAPAPADGTAVAAHEAGDSSAAGSPTSMKGTWSRRYVLLWPVLLAWSCAPSPGAAPPTLESGEAVAGLSKAAARKGQAARLRGVVVYNDRDNRRLYVHGARAGVFVHTLRGEASPDPGQEVEVTGTTAREELYNVVAAARVHVVGAGRVPEPIATTASALAAGSHAYEWVAVTGVVRSTTIENDEKPSLAVVAPGVAFTAHVAEHTGVAYDSFVDARVRIRGVSHPIFDFSGRVARVKLLVASIKDVVVTEPSPPEPFSLPLRPVASLRGLSPEERAGHRVRVRGRLIEERHDGALRMGDETGEVEIRTGDAARLAPGDPIEAVGFPSRDIASLRLEHALVRPAGLERPAEKRRLSVLSTVAEVHALTPQEAGRGYPVRLRGVVTYFDPTVPFTFLQDATGGIYINSATDASLRLEAGQLVEAEGESDPGYFAPSVYRARFRVLGRAPMPPVHRLTLEDMVSGQQDSNWVEARGIVQSLERDVRGRLSMVLAAGPHRFYATVQGFGPELPRHLVDASVAVRGACGAVFNEKRQLLGLNLYVPQPSAIVVEAPAPADPFALPLRPIQTLMRFVPGEKSGHRVRIRGVVTLQTPGESMFVKDQTGGLYVESRQEETVAPGEQVDVVGFAALGEYTPLLREAVFRKGSAGGAPPQATAVTAEEAMSGNFHAQLVQIEALFLDQSPQVLTLQSGPHTFNAFLPHAHAGAGRGTALRNGSLVRVTGICLVQASRSQLAKAMRPRIESFRIRLRTPGDVAMLRRASWWTAGRALAMLGAVAVVAVVAMGWVLLLRRRVQEAVGQLKILKGMLPICAGCKKIRDDAGAWKPIESYISEHSEAGFSHGLCQECMLRLYPDFVKAPESG